MKVQNLIIRAVVELRFVFSFKKRRRNEGLKSSRTGFYSNL